MYILHKTFLYYIEWQGECGFALNKRSLGTRIYLRSSCTSKPVYSSASCKYVVIISECGFALNKRSLVCLYHSLGSLAFIN
jgi:hypothetical protein